jgi:RNA polymerase sigma-70 factor (ECF subfamily)
MDDQILISRFQETEDRAAFEEIINRYEDRVFRFGFRMCGQEQDAEDVVQDTFVSAFRYLKGFRGEASLLTWLLKIASSVCLKKRRLKKDEPRNHVPFEDLQSQGGGEGQIERVAEPTPDALVLSAEVRAKFHEALAAIPAHYRQVLVLRELEGLSTREVSDVLEIS